jgi:hypothetical protein
MITSGSLVRLHIGVFVALVLAGLGLWAAVRMAVRAVGLGFAPIWRLPRRLRRAPGRLP